MSLSIELIHGIAGVVGSVGAMALTYPLLTVATRQQVKDKKQDSSIKIFNDIIQKEGWQQLYSGLQTSLIGIAASMGIYFYSYEKLKSMVVAKQNRGELTTLENLLIGYVAGAINMTITTPFWVVSTRLQARRKVSRRKEENVLLAIWKESGIKGFFKGWYASMVLCINPAIQWMVYEQLAQIAKRINGEKYLTSTQVFIFGAIGKIISTLITYPYIVVKSRMQASSSAANTSNNKNSQKSGYKDEEEITYKYNSITSAFIQIYKTEGISGLYKGLNSKIVQSVLNSALMFVFKEKFVSLLFTLLIFLYKFKNAEATK